MNTKPNPRDLALKQAINILSDFVRLNRLPPNDLARKVWKDSIDKAQNFIYKWEKPIDRSNDQLNIGISSKTRIVELEMTVRLYNVISTNSEKLKLDHYWSINGTVEDLSKIEPRVFRSLRNVGNGTMQEVFNILKKAEMYEAAAEWEPYT
jgi:hypothetical protein